MIYLLSIDGGGVKGLIPAKILYNIETILNVNIYDRFDGFAGTSIGAVIVTALAHKKMKAVDIYRTFSQDNFKRIFHKDFTNYLPLTAKYSGDSKLQFFKDLYGSLPFYDNMKEVFIPAYELNTGTHIFNSKTETENYYAYDVVNASTSAPTYFPSYAVNELNFIDGGIVANDPSMILLSNYNLPLYGKDIKLLSISCGRKEFNITSKTSLNYDSLKWLKSGLIDDFMIGEVSLADQQAFSILGNNYLRLDFDLKDVSNDLDDYSDDNILAMNKLADTVFKSNYRHLKDFFKLNKITN